MSAAHVCDNCDKAEIDREDYELYWLTVGFASGQSYDACSVKCARKILKDEIAPTLVTMAALDMTA